MILRHRWLAALAVVTAAGAAWAPARADEPALPEGTEVAAGIPPFVPGPGLGDGPARTAWIERMVAAGRAVKGTRRAAELLYSAAALQATDASTLSAAGRTYYEAWASAPTDDPMGAFGALRTFQIALAVGRFDGAKPYAAWLEEYGRRYVVADGDAVTARRFALLQQELATGFQADVATLLAALGNHAGAAQRLERLAAENPPGLALPLAALWERAALERFRAGQAAEARADVHQALAAGPDPAQRARLFFWELHLRHGLLTPEGEMRPTGLWPGKAYLDDLEPVLRELHGNPHVGALLLSAASSALLAKADEDALTLYRLALDDPALAQRLWQNASLWGALLPAVTVATRLHRFDAAEALLADIERLAGEPVPLAESLRVRVKLARAEAARASEERTRPPGAPGAGPATGAPRAPPELVPPGPPDEVPRRAGPTSPAEPMSPGAILLPVLGALGALLALALLSRRRRR